MPDIAASLEAEYRLRFASLAAYRQQVWRVLCADFFSRLIPPDAHVLDLGAGWCEFINQIDAARKYAMDLNPETGSRLQAGARFLHQDCAREWELPAASLDVVFTSNFLEHLPDKASVERTLGEAYRCLKPGGLIICLGPNIKFVPGAYWDFWDHYVPLTESSLAEALKLRGYAVERCVDRFLPYSMSTGRTPPLTLVRLYLRLPLLWRWFGKQFLIVARKPPQTAGNAV